MSRKEGLTMTVTEGRVFGLTFEEDFWWEDFNWLGSGRQLVDCGVVEAGLGELLVDCWLECTVELLMRVRTNHFWVALHLWALEI
jgi:hypothetical protein